MPRGTYAGEFRSAGLYQVTFHPQRKEFHSEEAAWDAVRHSAWNCDTEFEGTHQVELIESTVPVTSHPYECETNGCGYIVSSDNTKPCCNCGKLAWRDRSDPPLAPHFARSNELTEVVSDLQDRAKRWNDTGLYLEVKADDGHVVFSVVNGSNREIRGRLAPVNARAWFDGYTALWTSMRPLE